MIQRKLNNYWDIFYELVRTDFSMRYHNSVLGFIWVILKPLLIFTIIFLVFSFFFQSQDSYYQLSLLLGILIYSYFSEGTLRGVKSLYEKSNIILKLNFPKIIAIFVSVANSFISFFFGFLVFLIFFFVFRPPASLINLPYFLLQILILTLLIIGINFFTSIIYIRLRDLYSIWEVLLQIIFYGSPIIFPLSVFSVKIQSLILLNPLAVIIEQSRASLITGTVFSFKATLYSLVISMIIALSGWVFFQRQVKKIAEYF